MMEPLNIENELQSLDSLYKAGSQKKAHILVLGSKGVGKTTLIGTMPKPVFVISFAPGGTQVLSDQIARGEVVVDTRCEEDSVEQPKAFANFTTNFNRYKRGGMFDRFQSFALDGLSEMGLAIKWQLMKKEGRLFPPIVGGAPSSRKEHGLQIQDWDQVINNMLTITKQITALPLHTLMTGHISRTMDMALMTYIKALSFPGQSSELIPDHIPECYCLLTKEENGKVKRWLLTQNTGEYKCGTRMGAHGKFNKEEPPDIVGLLKKAGFDYADKPLIQIGKEEGNG